MSSTKNDLTDLPLGACHAMEALHWWIRAGVTDALAHAPHSRFADSLAEHRDQRPAPNVSDSIRGSSPAVSSTGSRTVFADGVPGSRVMFVGEAPGGDEDRIGRPFVGRAGQLLDRMLKAIGLDRQKVYIANVVPWRPPGNRTPTPQETQTCLPFIERQIHLANPEFLVCLGASAARTLLGVEGGIMRARGSWFDYPHQIGGEIRALAMLHPAFLLRQPAHKQFAWADMRALVSALKVMSR
jgi:uracil-DNA glycosylase family 4